MANQVPSDERPLELRYHNAMPGWCKIIGLKIIAIHECEGGGFAIAQDQAEKIMRALSESPPPPDGWRTIDGAPRDGTWFVGLFNRDPKVSANPSVAMTCCVMRDDFYCWNLDTWERLGSKPSLWQPLPAISNSSPQPAGIPTDKGGWIEWKGGECPVDKDATVAVKTIGSPRGIPPRRADTFWWGRTTVNENGIKTDHLGNIIAYRIVSPPPPDSPEDAWRGKSLTLGDLSDMGARWDDADTVTRNLALFIEMAIQRRAGELP